MVETIKEMYSEWKTLSLEDVKSLVPYTITQKECDEILGATTED